MRAHGTLLRGTISFRKSYVTPVYPELQTEGTIKVGESPTPVPIIKQQAKEFDAHVNVSDVTRIVLEELQFRARGWWRASDE